MASNVPLLENDDTLAFGEEDEPKRRFKHPIVTLFHMGFRSLALIVYLLCGWFNVSFIGSFVTVVLLLSMDFWTVKNITGRLMVGLRWWNYIDEQGSSHWVFEAKKGVSQGRVSGAETKVFWGALVVFPVMWGVMMVVTILTLNFRWFILVCIAMSLSCSNLWGFVRCKAGGGETSITDSMRNMAGGLLRQQMVSNVTSFFTKTPPNASRSNATVWASVIPYPVTSDVPRLLYTFFYWILVCLWGYMVYGKFTVSVHKYNWDNLCPCFMYRLKQTYMSSC